MHCCYFPLLDTSIQAIIIPTTKNNKKQKNEYMVNEEVGVELNKMFQHTSVPILSCGWVSGLV